jgi:Tfp pilus assembly protein PilZ
MRRRPANERASERVRIGAPATLKWADQELTGFVEVVNVAGMYVATQRASQPQIGDYVELVFSLPGDNRSFRVRGNVVFLEEAARSAEPKRPGFGARFERPPVTLLDAIRNLNKEH